MLFPRHCTKHSHIWAPNIRSKRLIYQDSINQEVRQSTNVQLVGRRPGEVNLWPGATGGSYHWRDTEAFPSHLATMLFWLIIHANIRQYQMVLTVHSIIIWNFIAIISDLFASPPPHSSCLNCLEQTHSIGVFICMIQTKCFTSGNA
jgi:hypothetical protein